MLMSKKFTDEGSVLMLEVLIEALCAASVLFLDVLQGFACALTSDLPDGGGASGGAVIGALVLSCICKIMYTL